MTVQHSNKLVLEIITIRILLVWLISMGTLSLTWFLLEWSVGTQTITIKEALVDRGSKAIFQSLDRVGVVVSFLLAILMVMDLVI